MQNIIILFLTSFYIFITNDLVIVIIVLYVTDNQRNVSAYQAIKIFYFFKCSKY